MMKRTWTTKRQLLKAGAEPNEIRDLLALSGKLSQKTTPLSRETKRAVAAQIGFKPVHAKARRRGFETAAALMACIMLIVGVQFASPGSPLYALRRGTENVRAQLQPGFKKELEQQREEEAHDAAEHAGREDNHLTPGSDDSSKSDDSGRSRSGSDDSTSGSNSGSNSGSGSSSSGDSGSNSGSGSTSGTSGKDSGGTSGSSGTSGGSGSDDSSNTSGSSHDGSDDDATSHSGSGKNR